MKLHFRSVLIILLLFGLCGAQFLWVLTNNKSQAQLSEGLELKSIQSIILKDAPANADINQALADFKALWYFRVGTFLVMKEKAWWFPSKGPSIILKRQQGFKKMTPGTFVIKQKGQSIYIFSPDQAGWASALYTLAADLLGARWYWPTNLGFEWVGEVPRIFPAKEWTVSPSFEMRKFYPNVKEYSLRNRHSGGYSFNHNLAKIFKPEYTTLVPKAFAKIADRETIVKGSTQFDPQPNFTNQEAVEWASIKAIEYFEENPSAKSFSLSPNDNTLYDISEDTQSAVAPLSYFRGLPNYTDLTFEFANKVAERVFSQSSLKENSFGEDRYLTMLAYYWTEQSPGIKLHPRVLPILTSDRAQWHDPDYRKSDKSLIKRWADSGAEKLGTWDYYFGAPYPYPRQFNAAIIESIPYLREQGIDIFFSQLPSMWGLDGAKAWLASQLLWDSSADATALLNEYYHEFFGPAGEAIRAFYEKAEAHRNGHAGKANWIKFYYDEAGIELFPVDTLKVMRDYLEQAKASVEPESRFAKRVKIVSEAFKLTEMYSGYHHARKALVVDALGISTVSRNPEALLKLASTLERKKKIFEIVSKKYAENPLHARFSEFLKLEQTNPVPSILIKALRQDATVDRTLANKYKAQITTARAFVKAPHEFKSLVANPLLEFSPRESKKRDFLGPVMPDLKDWRFDYRSAEAFSVSPIQSDGERASGIRVSGTDAMSLFNYCNLNKTRSYLIVAELNYKISPDCRIQLRVDWYDAENTKVLKERLIQLPNGDSQGFRRLEIPLVAPENAVRARIYCLISRQYLGDFLELKEFDLLSE